MAMQNILTQSRRYLSTVVATAVISATLAGSVFADATEVKISYQYGLGFFPVSVALEQKLIEKHAKALGLAEVKVTGIQISGAATTNDALLSGSIDIGAGGIGGVLQMWDKTGGKVRGLIALNDMSFLLNTNDPNVKTIDDYLTAENHKIALPAAKVGAHAIVLAIAAEKKFGKGKHDVLDAKTISLPHPDALAALKGARTEIKSHFASLPFSYLEKQFKEPAIHTVLTSYDVLGGPHNNTLLYTMEKWQSENPVLSQAVFNAFVEAERWIESNPKEAAKFFKTATKSTLELADIEGILQDKNLIGYSPVPLETMKTAEFLHKVGRIKKMPASWKDYFWPVAHKLDGS
jgi:NitT/TauT family transport system substrate-binding protein